MQVATTKTRIMYLFYLKKFLKMVRRGVFYGF